MKKVFETLDVRFLERKNLKECWINSANINSQGVENIQSVLDFLKTHGFQAVSMRLFGSQDVITKASSFLKTKMTDIACPPLLILQNDSTEISYLNIQVYAISSANSKALYYEDELIGSQFEDDYAKYYMLRILPDNQLVSQYSQSQNIFEKAHNILESLGSGFSDTVRTWLFAQDILFWYSQLNKVRNQFFEFHNIYNKLIPASTGIGVVNPYNKALVTQLLAVSPKSKDVATYSVNSPLQCPTLYYKSSFSRAVKLDVPDQSRLYISGTASIDKTGKTVFIKDSPSQLEFTMRVVRAILNEIGMDWPNTVSSTAYFKYSQDFGLFDDYCRERNIKLPHIKVQADVCRNDLLFELELDAVSITQ